MVLAAGQGRQARNLQDAQWRESAGARRYPDSRLRRLGAFLLHRLSQPSSRLSEGVRRESHQLGLCRRTLRQGGLRRHLVIARSKAPKQSRTACSTLDCFALLAMTAPKDGRQPFAAAFCLAVLAAAAGLRQNALQPAIAGELDGRDELPLGLCRRRAWRLAAPRREHGRRKGVWHGLS